MLRLSSDQSQAMRVHLEAGYPHEACGILIGEMDDSGENRVVRDVVPVRNAWDSADVPSDAHGLHDRYSIDPADVARADKAARRNGWDIIGFFHSHPDSAAIASETDREWAWPVVSFVIAAVHEGRMIELRSWRLSDDRGKFVEERILVE